MKITVKNGREFDLALENLKKNLGEELVRGSQEAGLMLEGKIKKEWPVLTGTSSRDINTNTTIEKKVVKTRVGSDIKNPWSIVIEEGREKKKGKLPNFDGIANFLARKPSLLKAISPKASSFTINTEYDNLDSKQAGAVFVLARSIWRKGIEGKFIFRRVREKYGKNVNNIIIKRLSKFISS